MRTIGVVTTSRADWGIYRPVANAIQADPGLDLFLVAGGMHLSPEFGHTLDEIEADGFSPQVKLDFLEPGDRPLDNAISLGRGVEAFARVWEKQRPDTLLVLGDRFEMFAAGLAALPFGLPLAHIHGGELTLGAMDDALRHGLTKFAHLHFVATEEYARRVIQMGEEPWRVTVSGAPGLDNLAEVELMDRTELEAMLGMELKPPPLLVTFHPVTRELDDTARQIEELVNALKGVERPMVFTMPNVDAEHRAITAKIREFTQERESALMVESLGTRAYFSLMAMAGAMVGNSSSGIIEAPSFELPVVNIGLRQEGRVRAANVIDVGYDREEIVAGVGTALSSRFRAGLKGLQNPYGAGRAAGIISQRLGEVELGRRLLIKDFCDLKTQAQGCRARLEI